MEYIEVNIDENNYWKFLRTPIIEDDLREIVKTFRLHKEDWKLISRFQILSPEFIRDFKDYLDWDLIQIFQKLSMDIIEENRDKLNMKVVMTNNYLTEEFILRNLDTLNLKSIYNFYFNRGREWSDAMILLFKKEGII